MEKKKEKKGNFYLHCIHQWVVGIFQELNAELFEAKADAERGAANHRRVLDWLAIFWLLAASLVGVKGEVVRILDGLVVDELPVAQRLGVHHHVCPAKVGMSEKSQKRKVQWIPEGNIYFFENLSNASSEDKPQVLHNGSYSAVLCFIAF